MRRSRIVVFALVGLTLVPAWDRASASCAAPSLEVVGQQGVSAVVLRPGEEITVRGRHFLDGCNDTGPGESDMGCSGSDEAANDRVPSMEDVELFIQHGSTKVSQIKVGQADAGTADTDRYGRIEWTFRVPMQLPSGPAVIMASSSEPLDVTIRR